MKKKKQFRYVKLIHLFIIFLMFSGSIKPQTIKKNRTPERTHFDLEGSFLNPVNIPADALRVLQHDEIVLNSKCFERDHSPRQAPESWFEASDIHLSRSEKADLIIKAKNACLFGANIGPFWIFRRVHEHFDFVLAVNALGVEVSKQSNNGYRNIIVGAISGGMVVNITYKFNGENYSDQ